MLMACDIVWKTSFREALALAKGTGKLVLVSFLDPCCGACNRLKSSTLTAECVRAYVDEHFIAIKFESGADSDQFMRFGVTAMPTVVVLDAEGNEVFRKIGYFEPEEFVGKLEMAVKKATHRAATCHV
jgi:thioredoxin-related protein